MAGFLQESRREEGVWLRVGRRRCVGRAASAACGLRPHTSFRAADQSVGILARVQAAAEALGQLGFGADAAQLAAAFDSAAGQAVQRLRSAATAGPASEYQRALELAQKYSHLQPALAAAAAAFAARVQAAERALWHTVGGTARHGAPRTFRGLQCHPLGTAWP
jgi:hypothetical protein